MVVGAGHLLDGCDLGLHQLLQLTHVLTNAHQVLLIAVLRIDWQRQALALFHARMMRSLDVSWLDRTCLRRETSSKGRMQFPSLIFLLLKEQVVIELRTEVGYFERIVCLLPREDFHIVDHLPNNFIILHPSNALSRLLISQSFITLHCMINKNASRSSPAQEGSPQFKNSTTSKQRGSMRNVQEILMVASPRQQHPSSFNVLEDRPIEYQGESNIRNEPQRTSVSPQRRSLIRQNELWSGEHMQTSNKQELRHISDEYYGENVPKQTLLFLQRIKNLLIKEQQSLLAMRKAVMQSAISSIRVEFSNLRRQLTHLVDTWCKKTEQQEIDFFIHKGEMTVNGQIVELNAKITTRKEEVEAKIGQMNEVASYHQLVNKEEALKANFHIKKTVREVWSRNYELQVSQLQEEAFHLRDRIPAFHFQPEKGNQHEKTLYFLIGNLLRTFELFRMPSTTMSTPRQWQSPQKQWLRKEKLSQSPPSNTRNQQILQSLLDERMQQIQRESAKIATQYSL